jgi:hypothetical protein
MSNDNVTPIRGGEPPSGAPPHPPGVVLTASGPLEGFATFEVLQGLEGVCDALKGLDWGDGMNFQTANGLAIAAAGLCKTLLHRVEE